MCNIIITVPLTPPFSGQHLPLICHSPHCTCPSSLCPMLLNDSLSFHSSAHNSHKVKVPHRCSYGFPRAHGIPVQRRNLKPDYFFQIVPHPHFLLVQIICLAMSSLQTCARLLVFSYLSEQHSLSAALFLKLPASNHSLWLN